MNEFHLGSQELHQHVIDSFFKERLEFLVQTVPDADPEYLDEALRATQGLPPFLRFNRLFVLGCLRFIFLCLIY